MRTIGYGWDHNSRLYRHILIHKPSLLQGWLCWFWRVIHLAVHSFSARLVRAQVWMTRGLGAHRSACGSVLGYDASGKVIVEEVHVWGAPLDPQPEPPVLDPSGSTSFDYIFPPGAPPGALRPVFAEFRRNGVHYRDAEGGGIGADGQDAAAVRA